MNMNMKQIRLFLYAAISVLAVASCAKEMELVEPEAVANGESTTLTLTLGSSDTKTALVGGKTTWKAGDKVRIYNATGTFFQDVEVPAAAAGLASVELEVNMKDSLYYAVYPVAAANGCSVGKVGIKIPNNPDGLFSSANICAARSTGTALQMRNVTAVLKVNITSGNVIEILQVNAKNAMVGTYEADFSGADPVLTAKSGTKAATVRVGGVDGDYYIAAAPGTYAEEFSVTALRGNGGYQTLISSQPNVLAINTIVPLGTIGNNLSKGLNGEGTEANPYVISNLGEWGAFVASVNLGNPYSGKFVKMDIDIEDPATTPVGHYYAEDNQAPFAGVFQGNNHTINVALDGDDLESQSYVALFGVVDEGAEIRDITVKGAVKATGDYTAGIIGYARGSEQNPVKINNCKSEVVVTSAGDYVGGVAAYGSYTEVEGCSNTGNLTGDNTVAGVLGYGFHSLVKGGINSGEIKATKEGATAMYYHGGSAYVIENATASSTFNNGVGGVVGYAQNTDLYDCSNSGNVTAFMKVGGVVGQGYWSTIKNATNTGNVEGTGQLGVRADSQVGFQWGSVAGGIVGWINTVATVTDCNNSGNVTSKGGNGGIVGHITTQNNTYSYPKIINCVNTGKIISDGAANGGTAYAANPGTGGICGSEYIYRTYVPTISNCVNKGEVTTSTHSVGGILGLAYQGQAIRGGTPTIDNCVNEGNVSGKFWVGGILGATGSRYTSMLTTVVNCANHGKVLATGFAPDKRLTGCGAGGIVGVTTAYNLNYRSDRQIRIANCYNDGDVLFGDKTVTKPRVGGIIGCAWGGGEIWNNYNSGFVGFETKEAVSDDLKKYLGGIAGQQDANNISFCYSADEILGGQVVGTAEKDGEINAIAAANTVVTYDGEGTLSMPITVNKIDCTTLIQALNEWQNAHASDNNSYKYNNWTGATAHPVLDTTSD